MKITYITHACLLIEIKGKKILTDPWLVGSCWAGAHWHYPPAKREPETFKDIDFLYFSHAHEDHFQLESIQRLPPEIKNTQVIVSDFDKPYFERAIKAVGFSNVKVMQHDESTELIPGVNLHMIRNDKGDDDSSIIIQGDNSTVFCQTDNLMSLNEAERLGKKFDIDVLFTINSQTGIFPGFYDFPEDVMMKLAKKKNESSANYSINIAKTLKAKTVIPYASDMCYLGELYFANDLHYADKNQYATLLKETIPKTEVYVMGPDDILNVNNGISEVSITPPKYTRENLGAYAVEMREEITKNEREEKQYINEPFEKDIQTFRNSLDELSNFWHGDPFNVLWIISSPNGEKTFIAHNMPLKTKVQKEKSDYDLRIEIPTYRLQRLVRGDYPMGCVTIRNGCVRCHRHSLKISKSESEYWELTTKIKYKK